MTPNLVNGEPQKGHTAAPANVLDTLRHLRSRSPQESLGGQTQRGLLKAFLLATVITSVAFVALTVVPYLLHKSATAAAPAAQAGNGRTEPATTVPAPTSGPDQTAKTTPGDPGKTKPKGKDLPDVLGESGVKTGNPKVNPLDKKEDDIFKELGPK